jgi:hypothetical protein
MKFYRDDEYYQFKIVKINADKLTAIHSDPYGVLFYKNSSHHNSKNASFISSNSYKDFYLNDQYYGDENCFTKQSWRRFIKMQAFL